LEKLEGSASRLVTEQTSSAPHAVQPVSYDRVASRRDRHQIATRSTLVFQTWLGKNDRMNTKLNKLLALGLFVAAGLCFAVFPKSGSAISSPPPPPTPAAQIKANIVAMLQRNVPIKVLSDIPGGARTATNEDAAYFAWQEFIALNWANFPVTGAAKSIGPGSREFADYRLAFGQPPVGSSTSYPALVWESTRHRAEIYTGSAAKPNGFTRLATDSWGYNSTPGYVYPALTISASKAPTDCKSIKAGFTPFVNLDEASQIGTCQMFSGQPYSTSGPANSVLFLAKANFMEYGYIASRAWYNTSLLANPPNPGTPQNPVASFANTSGYIVTQGEFPAPGVQAGTPTKTGSYISFPNGTIEFKAAFRVATNAERLAYESGRPIPGGYHAAPIRYYRALDQSGTNFEYIDTCGVLLSLHIIHKTPSAPYFIFATFEHKNNIIGTDGRPTEDANGFLNPNAYTTGQTPAPPPYVYPSAGPTPSPGKYLVAATGPNVLELPSQFTPGASSVTTQTFVPSATSNGGTTSTTQSYYQNTQSSDATLEAGNPPDPTKSYITVNRRRFSIPSQPIIKVNQDVHSQIATYGYNRANNVWLNYKLVNVQWIPAGNQLQKTPGLLYGDTSLGAKPIIAPESFYLSNSLVETNMILSAFSGQFNFSVGDGLSITDFYYANKAYTNNNSGRTASKTLGAPFYNIYTKGGPYNMGGCMGCHGNTTVNGGSDASFILGHGRPFVVEGVQPPPNLMLLRHRSYFR
jgi:hypothetical protein